MNAFSSALIFPCGTIRKNLPVSKSSAFRKNSWRQCCPETLKNCFIFPDAFRRPQQNTNRFALVHNSFTNKREFFVIIGMFVELLLENSLYFCDESPIAFEWRLLFNRRFLEDTPEGSKHDRSTKFDQAIRRS